MYLKSVFLTLLAGLGFILAKTPKEAVSAVTGVQVFDRDHRMLADIKEGTELAVFNQLWASKHAVPGPYNAWSDFHYSIILADKGIWLYARDGYITKLDHLEHTRYQVKDVRQFNSIIGIEP